MSYFLHDAPATEFMRALVDSGLFCSTSTINDKCMRCRKRYISGRSPYCTECRIELRAIHRSRADKNRRRSQRTLQCPTCEGTMWVGSSQCAECHRKKAA